jgi:hypothetical protein
LPANLTERRFRALWEQTSKSPKDEIRFHEVLKLMQSGSIISRPNIGKEIKERFADGKWHTVDTIAGSLELDPQHVADTLRTMLAGAYGCKAERKEHSSKPTYRIFKSDRMLSASEVIEKLTPIVERLRFQGKASAATASPASVAILAHELQKLLDEWAP